MVYGATSRQGKRGASGKAKKGHGVTGTGDHFNRRKKSKLIVTFDPEKRKEYLTGFHKRKQERRRFGLDMEAYKVKKRQLEAKKQRREAQKEKLAALNILDEEKKETEEEEECDSRLGGSAARIKVTTFNDEFTQNKFGTAVTVTTSVGDLHSGSGSDSDEEVLDMNLSEEDVDTSKHIAFQQIQKKRKKKLDQEQHLTLFQRIQQQRKGKALPTKRSKLKEARTARKAMMGKKSNTSGTATGSKRGAEDGDGRSSATSKLKKKLKLKNGQGGGNKRQKMR